MDQVINEKQTEQSAENQKPLDTKHVLMVMTQQIAVVAWQKMGLQPDSITNTIQKDLEQAKLAIDAANKLSEVYQDLLSNEEKNLLQNMLKDLKLNFVTQQNS